MAPPDAAVSNCGICALIERCRAREFPDLIAELPRSWLILGDAQFYRGYCVLLAKRHVSEPYLMPRGEAHELHDEMLAAAKAIAQTTTSIKINYECLGNQEPHVHWHLFPRFADDAQRLAPVWERPLAERKAPLEISARTELIAKLRAALATLLPTARW